MKYYWFLIGYSCGILSAFEFEIFVKCYLRWPVFFCELLSALHFECLCAVSVVACCICLACKFDAVASVEIQFWFIKKQLTLVA